MNCNVRQETAKQYKRWSGIPKFKVIELLKPLAYASGNQYKHKLQPQKLNSVPETERKVEEKKEEKSERRLGAELLGCFGEGCKLSMDFKFFLFCFCAILFLDIALIF